MKLRMHRRGFLLLHFSNTHGPWRRLLKQSIHRLVEVRNLTISRWNYGKTLIRVSWLFWSSVIPIYRLHLLYWHACVNHCFIIQSGIAPHCDVELALLVGLNVLLAPFSGKLIVFQQTSNVLFLFRKIKFKVPQTVSESWSCRVWFVSIKPANTKKNNERSMFLNIFLSLHFSSLALILIHLLAHEL